MLVRVDGQMFTEKKRGKETQTLASGPALPPAIMCCSHTNPYKSFFFGRRTESSLKKLCISL